MNKTPEEWRPVTVSGYEDTYEVSNKGRIRRSPNAPHSPPAKPGKILKLVPTPQGYLHVFLQKKRKVTFALVHHLVLGAFVGPRPNKTVCCHWDGDKTNNSIENLRWDSHTENAYDQLRHGRGRAKITAEQAANIKRRYQDGVARGALAKEFGLSYYTIWDITKGRSWTRQPLQKSES